SYIEYQYKSLMRTDYDKNDVAKYREFVKKYVTPVYLELRKKQSKRIGIEDMKAYDNNVMFTDGNAKPHGEKDFLVDNAKKMYSELSPETKKFFDFMYERELFDLESKKGKEGGGYCTTIEDYESPFIFANFNGTTHDVEVMTHEAGHAFQSYTSMDGRIFEYIWPTFEACEIHSMSMEFLTWPWMELFFEEETDKFKFSHLDGAISFIPYGVTIDHFQHFVYENPDCTPEERKAKYHEIELMYRPNLDYDDEFLEKGTWWYRQGHIFNNPFYYIDYTLAQVCAFQFLLKSRKNREEAFKDYLEICKVGGSQSFFGIMKSGNIKNPMNDGVLEEILPQLLEILDEIEKEL
ncbi:MAG: M3 family oligoendopeptidase, partial [Finegoldia magna]